MGREEEAERALAHSQVFVTLNISKALADLCASCGTGAVNDMFQSTPISGI